MVSLEIWSRISTSLESKSGSTSARPAGVIGREYSSVDPDLGLREANSEDSERAVSIMDPGRRGDGGDASDETGRVGGCGCGIARSGGREGVMLETEGGRAC